MVISTIPLRYAVEYIVHYVHEPWAPNVFCKFFFLQMLIEILEQGDN